MGEQVEVLEDHAHVDALTTGFAFLHFVQAPTMLAVPGEGAIDPDSSAVDSFKMIHTPKQRALARTGGADQANDLAAIDRQVDAFQNLQAAELLSNALRHYDDLLGRVL